jgi:hypothetical protein
MDEKTLREILADVLEQHESVTAATHAEHHEFIRAMIAREKVKAERWEAIQKQVLGWGVIALIGAIGHAVSEHLKIDISTLFR